MFQYQVWKEEIIRQVKNQAKATATHVKIMIIDAENFAESSIWMMQMQSHLVYVIDEAYNFDDTDDEEVLSENCDEINMLTVLTKDDCRHERSSKTLNKNKNIVQKCIEKKKQYIALKILCCENLK